MSVIRIILFLKRAVFGQWLLLWLFHMVYTFLSCFDFIRGSSKDKARQGLYNRNISKLAFRLMLYNVVRLESDEK